MIKVVLIEDEINAQELFLKLTKKYFDRRLKVSAVCSTLNEGVEQIKKHLPDVVFLDIELNKESGLELFKKLPDISFKIVFLSAHSKYALEAIKESRGKIFDYLLKPLSFIELGETIQRLEEDNVEYLKNQKLFGLLDGLSHKNMSFDKIALPTLKGIDLESPSNIVFCESLENYTRIITIHNRIILVSKNLKYIEDILPEDIFFRIHKSSIINLNFVQNFNKKEGSWVQMVNGKILDVSIRNKNVLYKRLLRSN